MCDSVRLLFFFFFFFTQRQREEPRPRVTEGGEGCAGEGDLGVGYSCHPKQAVSWRGPAGVGLECELLLVGDRK